jgi:hypothetical protein
VDVHGLLLGNRHAGFGEFGFSFKQTLRFAFWRTGFYRNKHAFHARFHRRVLLQDETRFEFEGGTQFFESKAQAPPLKGV